MDRNQGLISKLAGIAVTLGVAAVFAFSGGEQRSLPPQKDSRFAECASGFADYRHAVSWYRGKNRLQIKAEFACGSKYGEMLELKNVSLEIKSGSKTFARVHAASGTYFPKKEVFLIADSAALKDSACVHGPDPVWVDLKAAELRVPGLRKRLNTKALLSCPSKAGTLVSFR